MLIRGEKKVMGVLNFSFVSIAFCEGNRKVINQVRLKIVEKKGSMGGCI